MSGVDYLDAYRKFFDTFTLTVDPSDQLPVKVAGYNLMEEEIAGAVADWALQYLEQRRCPTFLIAHLVRRVVEEVRVQSKVDPISCGYRGESGDFLSLRLMQSCIAKLVEVCERYQDNAELSSLPPPHPLPPTTSCAVKNCRRSMEDRHVVIHDFHALFNIIDQGPASYYGVFDGHNGIDAAVYSVSHLHQYLAESQHYPNQPVLAMKEACLRTDQLFSTKADRENLHGGTTAVYALLRPKERKLYVGWLGDSLAVLVRRGVPYQIVRAHKPDRSDERDRIENLGGTILFWGAWRVNGQLALSRAIGDVEYKPYVSAVPDVEDITLDGTEDFLILGCDGLWDFVTEEEATNAVYKQLQENAEDLEAVSHRLVALAKEQSSQDNISVVVVFLADPAEVARRRPMEAAAPSPFVSVNGAEMFCGGPTNGQHAGLDDSEDFGPETDVDMVDDVLLSPAIAAAKALVQGKQDLEDDLERQRQQLSDFDDPADLEPSRDTPTPPAHEVASNANAENLAESGGEESEEEWNYFSGKDTNTKQDSQQEDPDDMSSQLNPNAAEFVPVSPTRLLLMDDAIISASPSVGFEKSMDNVQLPSELEFASEISQRPGDLDIANGPKHGDDYFMRDNFSTLRNKTKDFNVSSTCAVFGDDSVRSLSSDIDCLNASASENVPFDRLEAVQNMEEKVTSAILDKENIFPTSDISNSAFGMTNIFDKSDPMTTSTTDFKGFSLSPEPEDNFIPGTPKSTIVEAPVSPMNEDVSPLNHQTELDSPTDDYMIHTQKSPDLISPGDGPQDNLISGQERTSSSGFESESGAEEGESNVPEDNNEGFITEHRRSPPIDLTFKPIQTFSDTNPFGALQTPSATTPLDQFDVNTENRTEHPVTEEQAQAGTPLKDTFEDKFDGDKLDFLQNTPSSFISLRQPVAEVTQVPFDELESPKESIHFQPLPNANSSPLASDLPKTPEPLFEEKLAPSKQEPLGLDLSEGTNPEYEETSFTNEAVQEKEPTLTMSQELDTTTGFLAEESKIQRDELECEQISKLTEEVTKENVSGLDVAGEIEDVSPKAVEQVLAAFDDIKDDHEAEVKSHESDIELDTKEMKLEFESHIANLHNSSDELKNIVDSFEVIHKDELAFDDTFNTLRETQEESTSKGELEQVDVKETQFSQEDIDLLSPSSTQTNPFMTDEILTAVENVGESKIELSNEVSNTVENNLMSAINDFDSALNENSVTTEQAILLSSPFELSSPVEPKATKTVTYQMLTPADEPKISKSDSYITGVEEKVQDATSPFSTGIEEVGKVETSPIVVEQPVVTEKLDVVENTVVEVAPVSEEVTQPEETIVTKSEPVQSQVVTETLITALEETSEVPSVTVTEAPSSAGTPPTTPAPGVEDSKDDSQKTDILVAAVAAAGAVGAVAAGSALVADKEVKKTTAPTKKPAVGGVKAKTPAATKAPVTKTTTTTKPAGVATKPVSAAAASKPAGTTAKPTGVAAALKAAPVKAASAPAKKPTTTPSASKPATVNAPAKPAAAKPTTTTAAKPAASSSIKQVPNKLPVNKTTVPQTLKTSSKPTTPTSKPTTPTTPKSPSVVKSPPRLAAKTSLTNTKPPGTTKLPGEKPTEKKSLTNGDIKPLAKKDEVVKKMASTTVKPTSTTRPSTAPPARPTSTAVKTATTTTGKTTTTKTAAATTTQPKTKPVPATTAAAKSAAPSAVTKRPASAPAPKATEKTGKEAANKQISSTKPAVNGKTAPPKSSTGVKKTDTKVNGKVPPGKPAPIKKPEEVVKEEVKPTQIQEDNVTTTNGFAEHIMEEHESLKIEELAPAVVDGVN